tara:strand:+ start:3026 stop:3886 length:861 start_codon:yes stop_codon:yes gene_type:complete
MKLEKMHWIGIIFGIVIILVSALFFRKDVNLFIFLVGIAIGVIILPFVVTIVIRGRKTQQVDSMFLEFTRSLAESVSTGTPISKSIVNMRNQDFGPLSPHVRKLANQIELGIPVDRAMQTFAHDIDSSTIKRAIGLIREAEKAGGEIDFILDSTARSISEVDKLQKERKASISSLVVQGYIIFFIFIGIAVIMQFKILPLTSEIGSLDLSGGTDLNSLINNEGITTKATDVAAIGRSFLYLLLFQGFFAGLTIGKLAEGRIKAGIKHSFILMSIAFLVSSGANVFL